ncbi:MAG: transcriptional regulator [Alphaproteobacteria bacterium CG_4_10_14_0_8_um_filter_53_9]|nr:MAG: transcriptional regulator [Alphaproteobacteria bacterium CG_4_10_14_0_8_um_filter_53_9]
MTQNIIQIAPQVAEKLKALSHPKRLVLLCHMAGGERSVGDLARITGMRDAAVSQQLMLLRKDGVVDARREGQMAFYHLTDADTQAIMTFLYERFCTETKKNGY